MKNEHPERYPKENKESTRTRLIHGRGRSQKWDYDHHVVPPMTSSAAFRLDSSHRGARGFTEFGQAPASDAEKTPIYIYDRLDEPTRAMLEENLAFAEHGEMAVCFASGMAAISAALCVLAPTGSHIVAHHTLYGCTYSLLTNWFPQLRIATTFAALDEPTCLREAVNDATRVVYFETPVNPDMRLIDIAEVRREVDAINAKRTEESRIWVIVDNTFATPFCQRPLTLGADIVVESLTKGIGGFGTDLGGVVVGPRALQSRLMMYRKDFGGVLSPKSAWPPLVYGLPSLAARMANYQKAAHHIAKFLLEHPKVESVLYPGLNNFPQFELAKRQMTDEDGRFSPGSMLYFTLKQSPGRENGAERLIDWIARHAYCITLAVSLGQVKTLIECPYLMTHAALPPELKKRHELSPNGIRLSVGLEDYHDLTLELGAALDQA